MAVIAPPQARFECDNIHAEDWVVLHEFTS